MTLKERNDLLVRLHYLIKRKATGTPEELSKRLEISTPTVFRYLVPMHVALLATFAFFFLFFVTLNAQAQNVFAPPVQIWSGYTQVAEMYFEPFPCDYDGDGFTDALIYVRNPIGPVPQIRLRRNDGSGALSTEHPTFNESNVFTIFNWADIDGDGKDEFLTGHGYHKINANGNYSFQNIIPGDDGFRYLSHGFINADQAVDLILAKSNNLYVAYNDGNGNFNPQVFFNEFLNQGDLPVPIVKDMTGDGLMDIVYYPWSAFNRVTVFVQQQDGTFSAVLTPLDRFDVQFYRYVQVADYDHDGGLDVIFGQNTLSPNTLLIVKNSGNTFSTLDTITGVSTNGIFADFNMNGFPEYLSIGTSFSQPTIILQYNPATRKYEAAAGGVEQLFPSAGYRPVVFDYDGDGDPDILLQHLTSNFRSALYFYENRTITVSNAPETAARADHRLFPIPFKDGLQLDWAETVPVEAHFFDVHGRTIHRQFVQPGLNDIGMPTHLPAGLYFYRFAAPASGRWFEGGKVVKSE